MDNNQKGAEDINEPRTEEERTDYREESTDSGRHEELSKLTAFEYYKLAWENYANFRERASRAEFWYFTLVDFILVVVIQLLGLLLSDSAVSFLGLLVFIYVIASFIPRLALTVRRLHDINKSGANIFWGLIPIIGLIILLVYYVRPGDKQANNYGPVPEQ